ncbi:MAG: ribonuclease R [Alphaproteobacteria bacterium]
MPKPRRTADALPSKDEIVNFIRTSPSRVGKREIARAFQLHGPERIALKAILRELEAEGTLVRGGGRRLAPADALPNVAVLEAVAIDEDGEIQLRPVDWPHDSPPPPILLEHSRQAGRAPGLGERILGRLTRSSDGYTATTLRLLGRMPSRVVGVFERLADGGGRVRSTNRRDKGDYVIPAREAGGAKPGDIVLVETDPASRLSARRGRVKERIAHESDHRSFSLIAAHTHELPLAFPQTAIRQAEQSRAASLADRTDLRGMPFVTIDGADARDFDDAVFAERDADGTWHAVVAIADVGWYVRPGDALDRAAAERGNSVYFPDRVVPMLPEALSNDLCSLKPGLDRPCLAVHLWIDEAGTIRRHRFERVMIHSAARLTYEQVQSLADGIAASAPIDPGVIAPLYGVFEALAGARKRRGALDLDLPEWRIDVDAQGRVRSVARRTRLDSHRLIEELMIAANVAAAEALERHRRPCMYRVHDAPDPERLDSLAELLREYGIRFSKGQVVTPAVLNRVLDQARSSPHAAVVNDLVLRTQALAAYHPDNIGHFGLGLTRYCHFTSPIRRYADLLVHRALLGTLGLEGGAFEDRTAMEAHAERISRAERRGMAAERDALDRFMAAFLTDRVGLEFRGRITGLNRAGLFVTIDDVGASGLVPMSMLPDDFYRHDERANRLVGEHAGRSYGLGEPVVVRLLEAEPITGSLLLRLVEEAPPRRREAHKRPSRGSKRR